MPHELDPDVMIWVQISHDLDPVMTYRELACSWTQPAVPPLVCPGPSLPCHPLCVQVSRHMQPPAPPPRPRLRLT